MWAKLPQAYFDDQTKSRRENPKRPNQINSTAPPMFRTLLVQNRSANQEGFRANLPRNRGKRRGKPPEKQIPRFKSANETEQASRMKEKPSNQWGNSETARLSRPNAPESSRRKLGTNSIWAIADTESTDASSRRSISNIGAETPTKPHG